MRVYLVRHGQTAWNASGRAQGHSDIPLDESGRRQAELVAEAFSSIDIERIWSSDLSRALQTAEAIAKAKRLKVEPRTELRERSFGDWEGRAFHEVAEAISLEAKKQNADRADVRAPGGESITDVWERIDAIARSVDRLDGPTAIVTHGGTGALLLARILGGPKELGKAFRFGNTGVTELHRRFDGSWTMMRYNDVTHCDSLRAPIAGSIDGTHG